MRNSPDLTDAAEGTARGGSAAAGSREFQLGGIILWRFFYSEPVNGCRGLR